LLAENLFVNLLATSAGEYVWKQRQITIMVSIHPCLSPVRLGILREFSANWEGSLDRYLLLVASHPETGR
jgi:hypothetical protein